MAITPGTLPDCIGGGMNDNVIDEIVTRTNVVCNCLSSKERGKNNEHVSIHLHYDDVKRLEELNREYKRLKSLLTVGITKVDNT